MTRNLSGNEWTARPAVGRVDVQKSARDSGVDRAARARACSREIIALFTDTLWLRTTLLVLATVLELPHAYGQSALDESAVTQKVSPKELSIPASPIFDFMGVTPSQVVRTNDIKDFKVDWSFRSYRLSPNLAIQAQPVWEFFYNRKSLSKYQNASSLMRRLSTLDVSVGTIETENAERRIGYGIKMNLINQKDPLMMKELYEDLEVLEVTREATVRYAGLKEKYDKASESEKFKMFEELETARQAMESEKAEGGTNSQSNLNAMKERIEKITRYLAYQYWNSYRLDIAFARTYNYTLNENGSLASLKLNRNTGFGIWANGGYGLGRKIYLSGMVRYTKFRDNIDFRTEDPGTGQLEPRSVLVNNSILSGGINLRYGSPAYTFFAELLYERKKTGIGTGSNT